MAWHGMHLPLGNTVRWIAPSSSVGAQYSFAAGHFRVTCYQNGSHGSCGGVLYNDSNYSAMTEEGERKAMVWNGKSLLQTKGLGACTGT